MKEAGVLEKKVYEFKSQNTNLQLALAEKKQKAMKHHEEQTHIMKMLAEMNARNARLKREKTLLLKENCDLKTEVAYLKEKLSHYCVVPVRDEVSELEGRIED